MQCRRQWFVRQCICVEGQDINYLSYPQSKRDYISSHLRALDIGNFLKMQKAMVMQGLKWPPDVEAQTQIAKKIPSEKEKPQCEAE